MKSIYEVFEFNYIKNKLRTYAVTQLGKKYVDDLIMYDNKSDLQLGLDKLKQAIKYCYKYSKLPIYYHDDLETILIALKKGAIGSKEFFYQVSFLLENISLIKQEFKEKESFPLINEIISKLEKLDMVKNRIDRVISPSLDIYDSASSNLYRIRTKISHLESSIGSLSQTLIDKYRLYLSEGHSALRNGYFTLMVKSTYKNRVPGITHAVSDTGLTVFIQPQELIEVYNQIASLKEDEIQEIQLILKELSSFVVNYYYELFNNNLLMGELDFIFAKAIYAIEYNGEIASISENKKIVLLNAAHPLIDKNKVVRNNFIIDKQRMMIITGPNAGGKTVALKLVGLLVIMHQCALALPINEGGEIYFFKNIYANIGDNQSLLDNLSTFSSHIVSIEEIIKNVDDDSLVIIDELCSGTSPLDGEALGLGIIDYLINKNCFALLSSHYEAIKSYSLENDKILCASMIFDEQNIAPTYKLRLHVASSSYGIEVAQRFGLDDDIIKRAKEYIENRKLTDKEVKLELLNKKIEETEQIKLDLLDKEKELELLKKELTKERQNLDNIKKQILSEAENQKRELIENAKEEIDKIFKEFKDLEKIKLHQVIAAKKQIDDKALFIDEETGEDEEVQINDQVEIISSKTRGKVIRIDNNKVTILTDGGLNVITKANAIRKCEVIKKQKPTRTVPDFVSNMKKVSTECNVIGYTVKEAIEIVSKYLDDCVSVHYKQVRIIHGSGTGRLRSGIHQYLKNSPYVDSFRLGGGGEGGVGATVVTLK